MIGSRWTAKPVYHIYSNEDKSSIKRSLFKRSCHQRWPSESKYWLRTSHVLWRVNGAWSSSKTPILWYFPSARAPMDENNKLAPDRGTNPGRIHLSQCNTSSYVDMLVLYVRFLIPIWVLKYFAAFSRLFPWNERDHGITSSSQCVLGTWNWPNIELVYQV